MNSPVKDIHFIKTPDTNAIRPFIDKLYIPPTASHKGQNGKVLIIGGSHKYHAASIWAAEIASHFCDMVHYSSVEENNQILLSLKKQFTNGIVVHHEDLISYVQEDDAILIGPGMERGEKPNKEKFLDDFNQILQLKSESDFTFNLIHYLIHQFPNKKYVFDAAALQMIDPQWLLLLEQPAIVTPHQKEFEKLFGINVVDMSLEEKIATVEKMSQQYHCVIILKVIVDIISDGKYTRVVEGGNSGLTKGGTGDILAGLAASFYTKTDPLTAVIVASYLLKKTAEVLFSQYGYWYNMNNIIENLPRHLKNIL